MDPAPSKLPCAHGLENMAKTKPNVLKVERRNLSELFNGHSSAFSLLVSDKAAPTSTA
jgi:hypothetical protein